MKKTCFPDVQSLAAVNNEKVVCRVCTVDVCDTPLSRMVHAKHHLDSRPYHCAYCTYRSALKGEAKRHCQRQHTDSAVKVNYHETEQVDNERVRVCACSNVHCAHA